jgi:diaminopimelate epimerase
LLDGVVSVHARGGRLTIRWDGEGEPVMLTGPATIVFEGRWTPPAA